MGRSCGLQDWEKSWNFENKKKEKKRKGYKSASCCMYIPSPDDLTTLTQIEYDDDPREN